MKTYLLIPAVVWALIVAPTVGAQQHLSPGGSSVPIPSQSVLMPVGLHPSTHVSSTLHIDKKHRQQSWITGFTDNGDTLFWSGLKRGRLHGTWMSWYHPEQLCDSGRLVKNLPDGEWKSWYSNGQPRSLRTYSAAMLQRIRNEIPRRGGKVTFFAITDIARTDPAGAWHLLSPGYSYVTLARNASNPKEATPRSLEARVENNVLSGYHPYLPPFTECLHHGLYMNFYPNGQLKDSGYYQNGLREGLWDEWINNGTLRSTGAYRRGLKQDTWKYYSPTGQLIGIKMYNKRGKETGSKRFRNNEVVYQSNNQ